MFIYWLALLAGVEPPPSCMALMKMGCLERLQKEALLRGPWGVFSYHECMGCSALYHACHGLVQEVSDFCHEAVVTERLAPGQLGVAATAQQSSSGRS